MGSMIPSDFGFNFQASQACPLRQSEPLFSLCGVQIANFPTLYASSHNLSSITWTREIANKYSHE